MGISFSGYEFYYAHPAVLRMGDMGQL